MKKYEHIAEMETILDNHSKKIKDLNEILDYLSNNLSDYNRLLEYYYSDQRQQDLIDERNGVMCEKLKRGVLSEDAVYDLISDCYSTCIKMLELSTCYLKHN